MWLAGEPASSMIVEAGETLLPESGALADETGAAEASASGLGMSIPRYLLRSRKQWKQAVDTFERVSAAHPYDLVVGDETYEIAVALHRRSELKRAPFTIIYDFVGLDALTRNPVERLMVHVWNRTWCGGRRGERPSADRVLFVGEPADVPDRPFGRGLPSRREYARRYYDFIGYVLGFEPTDYADRNRLRACCSCAARGWTQRRSRRPPASRSAAMSRACTSISPPPTSRSFQRGGTTTLELTALRRPFIYFPLEGHCEQEIAVASRLAGACRERVGTARHRARLAADPHRRRPPRRLADRRAAARDRICRVKTTPTCTTQASEPSLADSATPASVPRWRA